MSLQASGAPGVGDPRYKEGLTHMQSGFWQEAIDCFEGLAHDYPGSETFQAALKDARLRQKLDASTRVRAKQWIIPWRPILVRALIVAGIVFVAIQGVRLLRGPVSTSLARAQEARQLARKEAECQDLLGGLDLDVAEACLHELAVMDPDNETIAEGLDQISEERSILEMYDLGVAAQEAGDYEEALRYFSGTQVLRPDYRDVSLRIEEILRLQRRELLYQEATGLLSAGSYEEALPKYVELKDRYANFRSGEIENSLYTIHMELGRALIERDPPASESVVEALDHFAAALQLQPTSTEAGLEQRLAQYFLEGQSRYQAGRWDGAITALRATYDQRPDYLHGMVATMLYEAYIRKGDQLHDAGECNLAWGQYGEAALMPVSDVALARSLQSEIKYCLTPTPTPTNTATPTPTPTPTLRPTWTPPPPPPTATATPTPTPTPQPVSAFRGKIIFLSDDPEQTGYWAMDPSGENRQYLGHTKYFEAELEAYRDRQRFSPDGNYRAYNTKMHTASPQIYIEVPPDPKWGPLPPIQISYLTGLSYDPVWSPDGGRIAFVSQENGSDDIWVASANGENNRALTRNVWEWDKHPSWSPDSSRIVFWSNRDGLNQIYVMDAEGRGLRKLSTGEHNETDPVWIK